MGIARAVVRWLQEQGHDAVHLLDEGLQRLSDREVFSKAVVENRVLLTFDLDFGEIVALSGGSQVSVIVFRLRNARYERVRERLSRCLRELGPELEQGCVVAVEDTRFRVRHLPLGT